MTVTDPQLSTRNAQLADLAEVLRDQQTRKLDMVIPATSMRFRGGQLIIEGADPVIEPDGITDPNGSYRPTDVFDEGVASKLGMPLAYVRRMRAERPDLYDANANGWLHGHRVGIGAALIGGTPADVAPDPRSFLVRTFRPANGSEGIARAFLSNGYRVIDHLDVLTAALDGIRGAGIDVKIDGCDLTERRMLVRVVAPEVAALAPTLLRGYRSPFTGASGDENPTVFAGFVLSNSETGGGAFSIVPRIVVQVCNNGLTMNVDALRRTHLGGRLDDGVVRWSEETQQKNLDLVTAQARDAVTTFLDVEYVRAKVAQLEADAETPVVDAAKTIEVIGKQLRFGEERTANVLDHFIRGGALNAAGVMAAVTSVAQTVDDPEEAYEMEAAAVDAMRLAVTAGSR